MSDQMTRRGDWSHTYTGRQFWPLDPRPEDVCLEDIAHHLSLICRFGGACRDFYSVAQHSVLVSRICPPDEVLGGLFHDAAEAYVGDMIRPLKRSMPAYQNAECHVLDAIMTRFSVNWTGAVYIADDILLATEARDLMGGHCLTKWALRAEPLPERIVPVSPAEAEAMFLERFEDLTRMRSAA